MSRILIIDDEEMILEVVKHVLEPMGHEVAVASDSIKGACLAIEEPFDVVVVDIRMPDQNGADVVRNIRSQRPEQKIVIATGYPNDPIAQEALDAGAAALLQKPFEIAHIVSFVES